MLKLFSLPAALASILRLPKDRSFSRCSGGLSQEFANRRLVKLVHFGVWAGLIIGFVSVPDRIEANEATRVMQGLRERRLYQLALEFGEKELLSQQLTPSQESEILIELMRVHSSLALQKPLPERLSHFEDAHRAAKQLIEKQPEHPQRFVIQVQDALIDLAAARAIRQELEVGVGGDAERQRALTELQRVVFQLEKIDGELEALIPQRFRTQPGENELSAEQLLGLKQRAAFQKSIAIQNQAMLFEEADQANRGHNLLRLLDEYEQLGRTVPNEEPLWWQIELEHVKCLRLLGNLEDADKRLGALPEQSPGLALGERVVLEGALLLLAQGEVKPGLQRLLGWAEQAGGVSPAFDEAILSAMLQLSTETGMSEVQQKQWQQQALAQADSMEQRHGKYWGRRASRLLVSESVGRPLENAALLIQVGDESYLKQQFGDAIQAYKQAIETAQQSQDQEQWLIAATKAGVLQLRLNEWADGSQILRDAAVTHREDPRAPKLHQQAIWGLSQAARADPERIDDYEELLEECIRIWPRSESANQARIWLVQLYRFRKQFGPAIDLCFDVSMASSLASKAIESAVASAEGMLSELLETNEPSETRKVVAQLIEQFDQYSETDLDSGMTTAAQQHASLFSARLRLIYLRSDYASATKRLESLRNVDAEQVGMASWAKQIDALYVMSLAVQPERKADLQANLASLANSEPRDLMEVVKTLIEISRAQSSTSQVELANTGLEVLRALERQTKSTMEMQPQIDRLKAQLSRLAGDESLAVELYESLLKQDATNGRLLEEFAELLVDSESPELQAQGLQRWRQLAIGSKPQSDRWFRAKYQVGETLIKLGKREEANRMLRFMKATPPGWEDSSRAAEFEALLRRSQ